VAQLDAAREVTEVGNVNAASDGLAAAFVLFSATGAALANVDINAASLTDETRVARLREEADSIRDRSEALLRATREAFAARVAPSGG
jgi:formiminotetrahydrofolate cyclodeaminase